MEDFSVDSKQMRAVDGEKKSNCDIKSKPVNSTSFIKVAMKIHINLLEVHLRVLLCLTNKPCNIVKEILSFWVHNFWAESHDPYYCMITLSGM